LKSYALFGIPPTFKNQKYVYNFLHVNFENNFNYFLDLIYHKILMMISIDYLKYDKVIYETLMELVKINKENKD
jgi:hypothetical protein